jgi:hypothetical protein
MRKLLKLSLAILVVAGVVSTADQSAKAAPILDVVHKYNWAGNIDAIDIEAAVFDQGATYLWQYTVTNHSFAPAGGNGFSGFELALPGGFPPDIGNVTDPGPGWVHNCCSGEPEEWDKSVGPGILVGQTGVFSFTTLPRSIMNSTGWFHSWNSAPTQIDVTFYTDTPGAVGPEAPNLVLPPIVIMPEPSGLALLSVGLIGLAALRRRRRQ